MHVHLFISIHIRKHMRNFVSYRRRVTNYFSITTTFSLHASISDLYQIKSVHIYCHTNAHVQFNFHSYNLQTIKKYTTIKTSMTLVTNCLST